MVTDIERWLEELRAAELRISCALDADDPDNYTVVALSPDDGDTYAGSGRTLTEAVRDALETKRLRNSTVRLTTPGQFVYEATIIQRITDAHKPHMRTRKRFVAPNDTTAVQLAAHAFRDRPGFISGSAKRVCELTPR